MIKSYLHKRKAKKRLLKIKENQHTERVKTSSYTYHWWEIVDGQVHCMYYITNENSRFEMPIKAAQQLARDLYDLTEGL